MSRAEHEVLWMESAIRDLEQIVDFIAEEAPLEAQRLFDEVVEKSRTLDSVPTRGRIVPELARFEIMTYREIILKPYRLMYRIDGKRVSVVGFFDGRRNLEEVLLSRLNRA